MKNTSTSKKTMPSMAPSREPLSESNKESNEAGTQDLTTGISGNEFEALYLKKDYQGAIDYLLANKQQFSEGLFHYNLGTVYSKMNDFANARFHLEKAVKEGHVNNATLNNLAFVKEKLAVDDLTTSVIKTDQLMNSALSIPIAGYGLITLIFILIILIATRLQKIQKRSIIIGAILLSIVPFLAAKFYMQDIHQAIALKDLPLFEGPSKIFETKGNVKAGSKIVLGEYKDGWFYVEFPQSMAGWVSKENLGLY